MKKKVLVAMSGGIDSSTVAYLLKEEGYEVYGVMMRLLPEGMEEDERFTKALADARRIAKRLQIPFELLDLRDSFEQDVIAPFVDEYLSGRTPNPCIRCNRFMKFGALIAYGASLGIDTIATGHYVHLEHREPYARRVLVMGDDPAKDQSYFMYQLSAEQLRHCLFPLGSYNKDRVREIAANLGFDVAAKGESQEICFIPEDDYRSFLAQRAGERIHPGDFIDMQGEVVGRHRGLPYYTVGQRKGLGLSMGRPVYVVELNPADNTIRVGDRLDLACSSFAVKDLVFSALDVVPDPLEATVKVRYRSRPIPCILRREGEDWGTVELLQPAHSVAPGQAAVFYEGDVLLGGGTIC